MFCARRHQVGNIRLCCCYICGLSVGGTYMDVKAWVCYPGVGGQLKPTSTSTSATRIDHQRKRRRSAEPVASTSRAPPLPAPPPPPTPPPSPAPKDKHQRPCQHVRRRRYPSAQFRNGKLPLIRADLCYPHSGMKSAKDNDHSDVLYEYIIEDRRRKRVVRPPHSITPQRLHSRVFEKENSPSVKSTNGKSKTSHDILNLR
ncbi:hypothetical protein DFP73DRAFT_530348 [Morchella snyderi]|nr:hypothetical protein DFP73DRAFT_530348 [Morchella snyderi]